MMPRVPSMIVSVWNSVTPMARAHRGQICTIAVADSQVRCQMALALKEELHRLVDEIPDSRPEIARVLFELGLLLTFASGNDNLLFRRFTREVAEAQAQSGDADELL